MLIFVYGHDAFQVKEKVEKLKNKFLEKNNGQNVLISAIHGAEFSLPEFRNKVLSAGFFAEKKMVILKDFLAEKNKNEKDILEIIKKTPEETVLVVCENFSKGEMAKSELFKFLFKQKYVFEFNPLSGNALTVWVRERAKFYGCEIDNESIVLICDILGNDLWKIDLELSKLCAYAAREKKVSPAAVKKLLAKEAEDNIFKFVDALAAKNKRLALLVFEEELRAGASELAILGAVSGLVRTLIQTKSLLEKTAYNKNDLAKKINIHPYVAQKSLAQAKNFHINELKNIYRELLKIDMAIKTSAAPAKAMFGRMIAKI